jgi:hypothetical protein
MVERVYCIIGSGGVVVQKEWCAGERSLVVLGESAGSSSPTDDTVTPASIGPNIRLPPAPRGQGLALAHPPPSMRSLGGWLRMMFVREKGSDPGQCKPQSHSRGWDMPKERCSAMHMCETTCRASFLVIVSLGSTFFPRLAATSLVPRPTSHVPRHVRTRQANQRGRSLIR